MDNHLERLFGEAFAKAELGNKSTKVILAELKIDMLNSTFQGWQKGEAERLLQSILIKENLNISLDFNTETEDENINLEFTSNLNAS